MRAAPPDAGSHLLLDVVGTTLDGAAAGLDVLTGALDGVAGGQRGTQQRTQDGEQGELLDGGHGRSPLRWLCDADENASGAVKVSRSDR